MTEETQEEIVESEPTPVETAPVKVEEKEKKPKKKKPVEEIPKSEEPIEEPEATEEKTEKPKKKKIVKKVKTNEHDEIIKKLMELEIEKPQLEKYEKIVLDSDIKPKEDIKVEVLPAPVIEKKTKKPVKVVEPVVEELEPIKLKPRKPSTIEKEVVQEPVVTRKLKSRIINVEFPPEAIKPVITDINAMRQSGELARTIEEAVELKKTKTKKFKQIRKPSKEIEKPELEVYEKYESDSDEPTESAKYQRPAKEPKPDEPDQKTLKLGKGKVRVPEEDETEVIKLKKIPVKLAEAEEVTLLKPKKQEPQIETIIPEKVEVSLDIGKFVPTDIEPIETPLEQYEQPEELPSEEPVPEVKTPKIVKKKKTKPEPETIPAQLVLGVPKPKETSPDKDVSFKYAQKPKPEEPVETVQLKPFVKPVEEPSEKPTEDITETISLPKAGSPEPVAEQIKLKKKKPKAKPEEAANITLQLKTPEVPSSTVEEIEENVEFVIKPKTETVEDIDVSTDISLPRAVQPTEDSAEASLVLEQAEKIQPDEIITVEEIQIKKKKPKKILKTEPETEFVLKPKQTEIEEVTEQISISKPAPVTEDSADATLTIEKPEEIPAETKLKLKKKKTIKVEEEVDAVVLKKPVKEAETTESEFTIQKPTKSEPIAEDVQEEFTIQKPKTMEPDLAAAESVTLKKAKKIRKPITESAEETVQLEEEIPADDTEEVNVQLSRRKVPTPYTEEDIEIEATLTQQREEEEEVEDVAQEFTIKKKPIKKPTPVFEEHDDEFTVKKLKKKQRVIEIPGYTDTENVTFRPRSTKTKEDVEQEFKIQLDSYAEEEVSMSGKVKLRKQPKPKTYSEEAGETHIRITEEYDDDGEGPIVEEIDEDLSEPEDTMYDVDEPDEFSDLEELPKEVEFKLKTKKSKADYKVEDVDEEDVSIHTVKRKQKQQVTYDEDSLTLKKQPKRKQSTYLEGYYQPSNNLKQLAPANLTTKLLDYASFSLFSAVSLRIKTFSLAAFQISTISIYLQKT